VEPESIAKSSKSVKVCFCSIPSAARTCGISFFDRMMMATGGGMAELADLQLLVV
jgi:hypothetical protein